MPKTKTTTIKCKPLFRTLDIDRAQADEETRTVSLAFSSEEPVNRFFGQEILDHSKDAIRLDRIKRGPVLVGHNHDDHVGVVESVEIGSDRRGRAVVRFGRSARAQEVFDDIQDGIRTSVSVGYRIHKMVMESVDEDLEIYRATDWEPFEISIVSVPADPTVGVGRSGEDDERDVVLERTASIEDNPMPDKDKTPADGGNALTADDLRAAESNAADAAQKAERKRVSAIMSVAKKRNAADLAQKFIDDGKSPEDFYRALLESDPDTGGGIDIDPDASNDIGLTDKQVRQFSFLKAIRAQLPGATRKDIEAAAFEREVSNAAAEQYKKSPQGFLIPDEVTRHNIIGKRDLSVGTSTAGGHTVETTLDSANFIDLLRNKVCVEAAGARVLTGLQGNLAIPRQTAGATAYWVAEAGAPTESQQAFDQVSLTPHTVGAFTDFSRKLVLQSSLDVEQFVRGDLAKVIGIEVDRVAIEGDPDTTATANEPRGILQTSGIGNVDNGTNGGAPTYDDIINIVREVMIDNALMGELGWIMNGQIWARLARTRVDTGSGQFILDANATARMLAGFPYQISQNVPADGSKGSGSNLSSLIFGNFDDFIFGYWSGVDLLVDPYTASTSGTVRVVALLDVDTAVRHAQSFAASTDFITT